ncbi:hypothetical protein MMC18_002880 [Xylographa bjoerkii]|nr:hypothetical protein [Xylographa bjoerkii]
MAEALAIIGLVSAIVQFVDFSAKVIIRLHEFKEKAGELPKVFQDVVNRLPLLTHILESIRTQIDTDEISEKTQQALLPVIKDCYQQIELLNNVLIRVAPSAGDSSWGRGKKAISSLHEDGKVQQIVAALGEDIQLLTLHQVTTSTKKASRGTTAIFMVPFERDKKFVGRRSTLEEIDSRFATQRRVAIAGLGGVGKSQIAIEYCYQFQLKDPQALVFWIYGDAARFTQAYRKIITKLHIPGWDDPKTDTLQLVCDWLSDESHGHWLLALDNADDTAAFFTEKSEQSSKEADASKPLSRYLPSSQKGRILITTRDRRVGERLANRESPILIFPMTSSEAEALLRSKTLPNVWSDKAAAELLEELAYLPLAITQAAAFISENGVSMSEYVSILRLSDKDMQDLLSEDLEDPRRDQTENCVMRTWKISFDQILKEKPRAAEILSLMAVLDRSGVPLTLIRKENDTEISLKTALGTLQAFSLIKSERDNAMLFSMHRIVQLTTKKWLELRGELSHWQEDALRVLSNVYPAVTFEQWPTCATLTPHVELVLSHKPSSNEGLLQRAKLLQNASVFDFNMGNSQEAYVKGMEGFAIHQRLLDKDDPVLLQDYNHLGVWYNQQGEYQKSKEALQLAVSGFEKALGSDHEDTLQSLENLALTEMALGEYQIARGLLEQVSNSVARKSEANQLNVLLAAKYQADITFSSGDLHVAEAKYRSLISRFEESVGSDNPYTLDCVRRLGLGPHHPFTMESAMEMARVLVGISDYPAAEKLFRRALETATYQPGKEDWRAAGSIGQLACILNRKAYHKKAEQLGRQALTASERLFGMDDLHTIFLVEHLADYVDKQGAPRYEDAERLWRRALAGFEEVRGQDCKMAKRCRARLRKVLDLQNKHDEALSLVDDPQEATLPERLKGAEDEVEPLDPETVAAEVVEGCTISISNHQLDT